MTIPVMLREIWPECARCAAGGITTSLGRGTTELSMAISRAISG
jgi:hypothetical protein